MAQRTCPSPDPRADLSRKGRGEWPAALTQIRGGVKQAAVLGEGVAVGLAGEIIGSEPRLRRASSACASASTQASGMALPQASQIAREQIADDPLGARHHVA